MDIRIPANSRCQTVREAPSAAFIKKMAKHLKESGQFEKPQWAEYMESSCAKELSPYDDDFLYIRAAVILRRLSQRQGAGVGSFQKIFGSTQNNGVAPSHRRKASGKNIRHCLQQLAKMQLVEFKRVGGAEVRILTPKGQSVVDSIAKLTF